MGFNSGLKGLNNVKLRQNNVLPNPSHTAHAVKESQIKKPSEKPKFDHDGQHYDHGIGDCDVMQCRHMGTDVSEKPAASVCNFTLLRPNSKRSKSNLRYCKIWSLKTVYVSSDHNLVVSDTVQFCTREMAFWRLAYATGKIIQYYFEFKTTSNPIGIHSRLWGGRAR